MKKNLSSHFQYNVWLYLLILVIAIALWCLVFEGLAQPSANEKISVMVFSDVGDFAPLQNHLDTNRQIITNQPLKEITIQLQNSKNAMSYEYVTARVLSNDFLVFQESLLPTKADDVDKILPTNFFQPIDTQKLKNLLGEEAFSRLEFYLYNDQVYGVYLNNADNVQNNFEKYLQTTDKFVLFLSHKSVNFGELYDEKHTNNVAGLDLLRYLTETN